ncbi:MAG: archaellin/type IV pilin N-terminal domain-containing protein [Candidatus Aenigmatarchaeota archaeon]
MRKGLSPLVGALVLVAIVVAVTAMVAPDILDFVEEQTDKSTEESIEKIDCTRAGIHLRNVSCSENGGTYEIGIEVRNTGYQDLTDFRLEVVEGGQYYKYNLSGSDEILRADDIRTFVNSSFQHPEAEGGRFISGTCPTTASREITKEELSCI